MNSELEGDCRTLEELVDEVRADMESILTSPIFMDLIESFQYCGFDVETISSSVNAYINAGDSEKRKKEISKLIYLGMIRGNTISKILKVCNEETADWLKRIVEELNIKNSVKDSNGEHDNKALTLSRLKKAFPEYAFEILKQPNFKRRVTVKMIQKKIEAFEILPPITQDMCVMSLLPKNDSKDLDDDLKRIMLNHIFIYCFFESFLIELDKKSEEDRAEDVIKYMKIMWEAKHVDESRRKHWAECIKDFFAGLGEKEMNTLKVQCDLIEDFASKYGVNISKSLVL